MVEDLVRERAQEGEEPDLTVGEPSRPPPTGRPPGPVSPPATRRPPAPPPGILELEDLLSKHLNTRVKVDMGAKRGRVVVDFATLEDLERIYKLMVGDHREGAEAPA